MNTPIDSSFYVPGITEPTACQANPKVIASIKAEIKRNNVLSAADARLARNMGLLSIPSSNRPGLNDGIIFPMDEGPQMMGLAGARLGLGRMLSAPKPAGQRRALALMVDFEDNPGKKTSAHFHKLLFDDQNPASMRSFYRDVSYGQLDVEGVVSDGWIRAPRPYSWYTNGSSGTGADPRNSRALLKDVLTIYCKTHGLGGFDLDGDGFMDGLFMIFAGTGAESEPDAVKRKNMIWSHKWILPKVFTNQGVKAYAYFTAPEDGQVGVFAHEFGHFLGLPDLYDTSYNSKGIGRWCLMAGGSWNGSGKVPARFSAWCLSTLGWIKPVNVKSAQKLTLPPIATDANACYRLWTQGKTGKEYFLIENRQLVGRDTKLPGAGLALWHVDENQPHNDNSLAYKVALVQADGKRDLEFNRNDGDAGDVFPGSVKVTKVNDTNAAHPHTRSNSGTATGVSLANIKTSTKGIVTADVTV